MDILNYPIAIAVTTTIVFEKILIQDVGFSLQYAPSIKTTGWKMLSCNSARPCVFVSCAMRETSYMKFYFYIVFANRHTLDYFVYNVIGKWV